MTAADHQGNNEQTRVSALAHTAIARYRIIEKLGAGGMGEVYLAFDPKLQRNVAIKLLPPAMAADAETKARFVREAQTAAALNHENIITIYEVDEHEGRQFIAMEYVEGSPLKDIMKGGALEVDRAQALVLQICAGLAAAHERSIVHRDIKPANILVTAKGRVKILDFGLAKFQTVSSLTSTGVRLGTITYMSPEQAQGADVDHRSDIFSLGVVLYELLTGQSPFKRDSEVATLLAILQQPAPSLRSNSSQLAPQWESIIERALKKDRCERFQSIEEFSAALRSVGTASGVAAPAVSDAGPNSRSGVRLPAVDASSVTRTAIGAKKAIAILPFENLGPTEHNYFAEGITDEITTSLAKIKSLKVISNNSARQFDVRAQKQTQIAAELGVEYLLTATIRWDNSQSPSRFRMSCKLVDAKDESYLWAESYDRVLEQIFSLQSELAEEISKALGVALAANEADSLGRTPTSNLEAFDLYLRGNEFFPRSTNPEDMSKAIDLYEQAIALDPQFALAHVRLSMAHSAMFWFFHDRTPARVARAKAAAETAAAIAPDAPETSLALGYYHYYGCREYVQALEHFTRASKARPNDASLLAATGFIQRRLGLWNESLRNIRKAAELDPKSSLMSYEYGNTLMLNRQYDQAIAQFDRALWLAPDWTDVYARKALTVYLRDGDVKSAAQVFRESEGKIKPAEIVIEWVLLDPFVEYSGDLQIAMDNLAVDETEMELHFLHKGRLAARAGKVAESKSYFESARIMLESKIKSIPDDARYLAHHGLACAGLGRREAALASGKRAVELFPHESDQVFSIVYREALMLIYIWLAEFDNAVAELRFLLSVPSSISKALLLSGEDFKPLRGYPAFQTLLRG